jgi:hypothetical protein
VLAAETLAPPSDGVVVVARVDDAGLVLAAVRAEQVGSVLSGAWVVDDRRPLHVVVPVQYIPFRRETGSERTAP